MYYNARRVVFILWFMGMLGMAGCCTDSYPVAECHVVSQTPKQVTVGWSVTNKTSKPIWVPVDFNMVGIGGGNVSVLPISFEVSPRLLILVSDVFSLSNAFNGEFEGGPTVLLARVDSGKAICGTRNIALPYSEGEERWPNVFRTSGHWHYVPGTFFETRLENGGKFVEMQFVAVVYEDRDIALLDIPSCAPRNDPSIPKAPEYKEYGGYGPGRSVEKNNSRLRGQLLAESAANYQFELPCYKDIFRRVIVSEKTKVQIPYEGGVSLFDIDHEMWGGNLERLNNPHLPPPASGKAVGE